MSDDMYGSEIARLNGTYDFTYRITEAVGPSEYVVRVYAVGAQEANIGSELLETFRGPHAYSDALAWVARDVRDCEHRPSMPFPSESV